MPSLSARQGLNWLNFFTAAVQTGFGPFIAVYLSEQGWTPAAIGISLTVGTVAALVSQLPAGALVDAVYQKRWLTAGALMIVGFASLQMVIWPGAVLVWTSQILHAAASAVLVPAIAALTLSLYGHREFSARLGINARYQSLGNAVAAGALGLVVSYVSNRAVFVATAMLVAPALAALLFVKPRDAVDPTEDHPSIRRRPPRRERPERFWHIFRISSLHVFAVCMVLFSFSNAAMLPLALISLAKQGGNTGLVLSSAIVVPQLVSAIFAPAIGRAAQRFGRRPVLLVGFAVLPLRGVLLAILPGAVPLATLQALDGISASVLGIMVPLIAADLTRRSGYLNLAMNSLGLAVNIGASFSTTVAGLIANDVGVAFALLFLALIGALATAMLYFGLPETRSASERSASERQAAAAASA